MAANPDKIGALSEKYLSPHFLSLCVCVCVCVSLSLSLSLLLSSLSDELPAAICRLMLRCRRQMRSAADQVLCATET